MLQKALFDALDVHDLLLIEDNPDDVLILELLLSEIPGTPIVVHRAASAAEGIALALASAPEVILTDLSLPDATGLDVINRLRVALPKIPVVVLTGSHDTALGVAAVRAGAQDFLVKGETDVNALGRSLRHAIERHRLLQELDALRALEVHRATHDLLTSLPNRSLFLDRFNHLLARARRREAPFAVAYLDLDGFKAVNDRLGHQAGDTALVQVANRFTERVRKSDTLARLGGDEFAVLFEDLGDRATLLTLVEGIRDTLTIPVAIGEERVALGVSVGIAIYPEDGIDAVTLLGAADAAMYKDKAVRRGALCGR